MGRILVLLALSLVPGCSRCSGRPSDADVYLHDNTTSTGDAPAPAGIAPDVPLEVDMPGEASPTSQPDADTQGKDATSVREMGILRYLGDSGKPEGKGFAGGTSHGETEKSIDEALETLERDEKAMPSALVEP